MAAGRDARGAAGTEPSGPHRPRVIRARRLAGVAAALAMTALSTLATAVEPDEKLADPAQEARARKISAELRCLVCQNQSIDDSNAPLARDLRLIVREQIAAGRSDAEVMQFLVARYGEFVLLRPPFGPHTLLLWGTPILVLAAAGFALARLRGRGADAAAEPPLSEEERRRLETLTKDQSTR
jgi:cytochrome c-type biogenesis protein CcmH